MFYSRDKYVMLILLSDTEFWAAFLAFAGPPCLREEQLVRCPLCLAKSDPNDCCRWSEGAAMRRSCCAWSDSVRGTTARRPWSWSWSWPGRGSHCSWPTPCTRSWPRACASMAVPQAGAAPSTKSESLPWQPWAGPESSTLKFQTSTVISVSHLLPGFSWRRGSQWELCAVPKVRGGDEPPQQCWQSCQERHLWLCEVDLRLNTQNYDLPLSASERNLV